MSNGNKKKKNKTRTQPPSTAPTEKLYLQRNWMLSVQSVQRVKEFCIEELKIFLLNIFLTILLNLMLKIRLYPFSLFVYGHFLLNLERNLLVAGIRFAGDDLSEVFVGFDKSPLILRMQQ